MARDAASQAACPIAMLKLNRVKGQCKSANLETAIWRCRRSLWAARIDISYNAEQIESIAP
ncbi:MAG: hypothetical protein RLZZ574_1359 [Cyanobacteriota bacterium]